MSKATDTAPNQPREKPRRRGRASVATRALTATTLCVLVGGLGFTCVPARAVALHKLTVTLSGPGSGSVSAESGEIKDCALAGGVVTGTCSGEYEGGQRVTLTVSDVGAGDTITWSGITGAGSCGHANTCVVDVSEYFATTVDVHIAPEGTITVTPASTGGRGAISGGEIRSCAVSEHDVVSGVCSGEFEVGQTVTLTASEGAREEPPGAFIPVEWSGCKSFSGDTCDAQVEAPGATVHVIATFPSQATGNTLVGSFATLGPNSFAGVPGPPFMEAGLEEPSGIAVEQSTGDVFVYAQVAGEGAIYKFNGSGEPVDYSSTPGSNVITGVRNEPEEASGQEGEIAVSSAGPNAGDIYVASGAEEEAQGVKIYNGETGGALGTLPGEAAVAVGPTGDVYVFAELAGQSVISKYVPVEDPVSEGEVTYESSLWGVPDTNNIAVDGAGDVYVESASSSGVVKYEASQFNTTETAAVGSEFGPTGAKGTGVAVDPSTGDVYIDEGFRVAKYTSADTRVGVFGSSEAITTLNTSYGLAVGPSSVVYVDNHAAEFELGEYNEEEEYEEDEEGYVNIYGSSAGAPVARAEAVSELAHRGATLNGTVNPEETSVQACTFEYGTEPGTYVSSAPCSKAVPFSGDAPEPVSADVSGLEPDTTYYFRLLARSASAESALVGSTGQFTTPAPGPGIAEESVSKVTGTSAMLRATVYPYGLQTEYHFEYDTGPYAGAAEHGTIEASSSIGAGTGAVAVSLNAQGLKVGTHYYYRVVASDDEGSVYDEEAGTFTTQAAGGESVLPDGRQWELVSPPNKHGALIMPIGQEALVQASANGDAMTYITAYAPTEDEARSSPDVGVQVLSTRGADGWASQDIATPHERPTGISGGGGGEYRFFSEDLSLAVLEPFGPFTPFRGETFPEATERTVYLRHNGTCDATPATCYEPLVTASNVPPGVEFGGGHSLSGPGNVGFEGASPDGDEVIVSSSAPLTWSAVEHHSEGALYEWAHGELLLVSALPEATPGEGTPAAGGTLGDDGDAGKNARNAISRDGSRVVWATRLGTEHLYVRDTATETTTQLDAIQGGSGEGDANPAFQIASSDVSKVFFTDPQRLTPDSGTPSESIETELYECELIETAGTLECRLHDLTPPASTGDAAVLSAVLGASEDGSYVYFVAESAHQDKLYVDHYDSGAHEWKITLIATLSSADEPDWDGTETRGAQLEDLTARVSPNGRWLAFMSDRELTGYDNHDAASGEPDEEVYLYDAENGGRLVCASCNPTGARPDGVPYEDIEHGIAGGNAVWSESQWIAANIPGWTPYAHEYSLHQSRYLSDSGRLFFNSSDALVPQDVNGTEDVYEYEPAGVGSCTDSQPTFSERSGGCLGLISSGTSREESGFLDASETGGDVFFLTAAKLAPQDDDSAYDVYDAHECSSSAPCFPALAVQSPPCETGESCKPAPTPQPSVFGPAASATFSGPGNPFHAEANATVTPKPAPLTRAQKLAAALKACKKDRSKRKRLACERQARKKYAAHSAGKASEREHGPAGRSAGARSSAPARHQVKTR